MGLAKRGRLGVMTNPDSRFWKTISFATALAVVSVLGLGVCGGGCQFVRFRDPDRPMGDPSESLPFAPDAMEVHPLTRVDEADGTAVLEVYLELRDRYGDVVKATGRLTALLYRTGPTDVLGGVEPARTWELDLTEPAESSRYFDSATGLYRVRLAGLPPWLKSERGRLDVKFETFGPELELRTLRASRVLR